MKQYNKYAPIHNLLRFLGWQKEKESIVLSFSNQRTTSLKELTEEEFQALYERLKQEERKLIPLYKKQRSIFFGLTARMGYTIMKNGKRVNDYERIDAWLLQYGVHKQKSKWLNLQQLKDEIKQLRARLENG
ncbi:hypothetical protein [Flammeovirga sp. OC4]|uniref:hypothetical protein n=1 Tax=Flammeovirga sp. OC4 TaxID=1382345 RepID=UPI0005C6B353|nr:hypothetical protein [Flammeovirga sp. OC4]